MNCERIIMACVVFANLVVPAQAESMHGGIDSGGGAGESATFANHGSIGSPVDTRAAAGMNVKGDRQIKHKQKMVDGLQSWTWQIGQGATPSDPNATFTTTVATLQGNGN